MLRGISALGNLMGIKIVRSEGGVVFLVRECLVDEVEFITDVHYEESVWMKGGRRGSSAFYIGPAY